LDFQLKVTAIIPARGGSKGIPCKNVRLLAGKPLVAHTIEQALKARLVTRTIVSTDDEEIALVSKEYGAEVVKRPSELATDTATSESALLHALDYLQRTEGYEPDLVVFLQCTSPMRQPADIDNAIEKLQCQGADALFSACQVEGFIWRDSKEALAPINYDPVIRPCRQEVREEILEENGSIYIFKPWAIRKYNSRLGGKIVTYRMPRIYSFQVDIEEDLILIERLITLYLTHSYIWENISDD